MAYLIEKAGSVISWGWKCVAVEGTIEEVGDVVARLCQLAAEIDDEAMKQAIEDVLKHTHTEMDDKTARAYWPSLLVAEMKFGKVI